MDGVWGRDWKEKGSRGSCTCLTPIPFTHTHASLSFWHAFHCLHAYHLTTMLTLPSCLQTLPVNCHPSPSLLLLPGKRERGQVPLLTTPQLVCPCLTGRAGGAARCALLPPLLFYFCCARAARLRRLAHSCDFRTPRSAHAYAPPLVCRALPRLCLSPWPHTYADATLLPAVACHVLAAPATHVTNHTGLLPWWRDTATLPFPSAPGVRARLRAVRAPCHCLALLAALYY